MTWIMRFIVSCTLPRVWHTMNFYTTLKTQDAILLEHPGAGRCSHQYPPGDLSSLPGYWLEVYHRHEKSYHPQVFWCGYVDSLDYNHWWSSTTWAPIEIDYRQIRNTYIITLLWKRTWCREVVWLDEQVDIQRLPDLSILVHKKERKWYISHD